MAKKIDEIIIPIEEVLKGIRSNFYRPTKIHQSKKKYKRSKAKQEFRRMLQEEGY